MIIALATNALAVEPRPMIMLPFVAMLLCIALLPFILKRTAPNFMVKAIALEQKVHAPSFFEYILKFALPFLVPVLVTYLFF